MIKKRLHAGNVKEYLQGKPAKEETREEEKGMETGMRRCSLQLLQLASVREDNSRQGDTLLVMSPERGCGREDARCRLEVRLVRHSEKQRHNVQQHLRIRRSLIQDEILSQ